MEETILDDDFWNEAKKIQERLPIEERKKMFNKLAANYKGTSITLDIVLAQALICAGNEGILWFREAIPLIDRLEEAKKTKTAKIPKKTRDSIISAYLGGSDKRMKVTPKVTGKVTNVPE